MSERLEESNGVECHEACRRLKSIAITPCEAGNTLDLLPDGELYVPAMLATIRGARTAIDLQLYRADPGALWDSFKEVLLDAANRGLNVRLLFDAFGSRDVPPRDWQLLRREGIRLRVVRPLLQSALLLSTRRDHRKLLVVDGLVAYTGGMSIDDTFFRNPRGPTWRETMVRIQGPVVDAMRRTFDDSWFGRESVSIGRCNRATSGSSRVRLIVSTPRNPQGEALFLAAIEGAGISIYMTNPFVVPTRPIVRALASAVRRGVDVRLLVPGRYHRFGIVRLAMCSFYREFLISGIRIFEYHEAMLHAKTMSVDGQWGSVGSFNLDPRSFFDNDEIAIGSCDVDFATALQDLFFDDCQHSREVLLRRWEARGAAQRRREFSVSLIRWML